MGWSRTILRRRANGNCVDRVQQLLAKSMIKKEAAPVRVLQSVTVYIAITTLLWGSANAWCQTPKDLKTKAGVPVLLANFLNARPDCSVNPGPVAVPVVSGAPTNGVVQMQVVVSDVAASAKCPARRIASIALIYSPNRDFSGSDIVQLDVEAGNQKSSLRYQITVLGVGQQL